MEEAEKEITGFKFPKEERLHHRSLVDGLFRFGKSFYEFPFRVTWRTMNREELRENFRNILPDNIGNLQMMVTVPKKKRRHAVDRVKMRRRIREAYRLNRSSLKSSVDKREDMGTMSIALVYIHDKNLPYSLIEEKMCSLLEKLKRKIETSSLPLNCEPSNPCATETTHCGLSITH